MILADNSQSLRIRDEQSGRTRGEWLRDLLRQEAPWRTRLGQDFDVRGYAFDTHLRAVDGFDALTFRRHGHFSWRHLWEHFPSDSMACRLAGVLLFTDGNKTDAGDLDWSALAQDIKIYPVVPPSRWCGKGSWASAISRSARPISSRLPR